MRYFYSVTTILLSLTLLNCRSTSNSAGRLEDAGNGFKPLSGNISTKDIENHEKSLQSQSKLPVGDYNVTIAAEASSLTRWINTGSAVNETSVQECADLYQVQQSNADPRGLQKKYADRLGFKECRAAPTYTGVFPLRKCHIAFNCSGPMVRSNNRRAINLVLGADYTADRSDGWPCGNALDQIKTIDGKPVDYEALSYAEFTGLTQYHQKIVGCRFIVPL